MQIRYLDFGNVTPKVGIIGAAKHLGWQVDGYRVSFPRTIDDDGLNPFERVVLGIMRIERLHDVKSLSSEICLERDFVEGVLLRLRDKGLVDEQNRITAEGADLLSRGEGGLELRTAWVFRELVSGKLLPFIYLPKGDNPPKWKKEPFSCRPLGALEVSLGAPSPEEVLAAMRETKRRVESYGKKVHLPRVGQIDVNPNSERFFLDCPIVMREHEGRWRIADPFGYGYSRELETAFLQKLDVDEGLQNWLMGWSNKLVVENDSEDDDGAPYLTQEIRSLYPGLPQSLRVRKDGTRSIGQVYASIEWALFYSCRINGFDDKVPELRFASPKDQVVRFRQAMREIGCDGTGYIAHVEKRDLNSYLTGSPEMKVVLPMSILQAADDPSHPLRSFCERHPDFVARIGRMKSRRDAPLHGGDNERVVELGDPDDEYMKDLVETLLPQISFGRERSTNSDRLNGSTFRNINFSAENSIMGEFGPAVPYLKMTRGAREALLSAERYWIMFDGEEDIQPLINDYYAAIQAVLDAEIVSDKVNRPDNAAFDPCSVAVERCERLALGELPGGLLNAKRSYIQDALQGGGNHTLGPSLIIYLALAEETKLCSIEAAVAGYVGAICDLITLRGHGNGTIPSTKEKAGKHREFAFDVIKAVLEV